MQKPQTHPEHVFHFDDAALEDGRTDRRDLDGAAVPGLSAPRSHYISTQSGHNGLLLLHGSPRDEGLSLSDVRLGYHRSGSRVVEFGEDRDHFTCGSRTTRQRSWTFFFPISVYFSRSPNAHNVIALTRCVSLAVDLRGDGHLSKVVVPHTSHLLFGSSLRCLQVASKKKKNTCSEYVSSTANAESHLGKRAQAYE